MSLTNPGSSLGADYADVLTDLMPIDLAGPGGPALNGQADILTASLRESLGRLATVAAMALSTPSASVMFAGTRALPGLSAGTGIDGQQSPRERSLGADVVASEDRLIIGNGRMDSRPCDGNLHGQPCMIAWAGVPVHDQAGQVAGVLWVADRVPRQWSAADLAMLENLAQIASTEVALARYALRALARRQTRPSLLLADLNQVLLDWPTDDPRFMTAIYAGVQAVQAGVKVRISSAGHPLALVRTANGQVREFGRPGALLGVLAHPELHDAQRLLRAGDSLILFSDGVTEARSGPNRDLYGDERLRHLVARSGDLNAAAMAEAILLAIVRFSGGRLRDDTVILVMKVPGPGGQRRRAGHGQ
jgi:hypothetical protein